MEQILSELDIKCEAKNIVARIKEMMGETLATRFINYPMIKEMGRKSNVKINLFPNMSRLF